MRHIGKLKNSGQRVAVLFMQLPEEKQSSLVVAIDNMPDRLEQALMHELESKEGQADPVFANVLARRLLPDMGNMSILAALHSRGLISKVPVSNVIMYPEPNMPFPLEKILNDIAAQNGEEAMIFESTQSTPEIVNAAENRFNPHENNLAADSSENAKAIAKTKLFEAELLEAEAKKKREEAYRYDPSLKPVEKALKKDETVDVKTVSVKARRASKKTNA